MLKRLITTGQLAHLWTLRPARPLRELGSLLLLRLMSVGSVVFARGVRLMSFVAIRCNSWSRLLIVTFGPKRPMINNTGASWLVTRASVVVVVVAIATPIDIARGAS